MPTFVGQLRDLGFRVLTAELASISVQVIYATNPNAIRGAREATTTLPIVGYDYETNPVAAGYAASLARPGSNVTGVFLDQVGVSAKQLQLLTELLPGTSRVAVREIAAVQRREPRAATRAAPHVRCYLPNRA